VFKIREAIVSDIPQIQVVRNAVQENRLSNPALVTDADCEMFLTARGKGWVAESGGIVVGFAIADLLQHNVWALFVTPAYAGKGIGKKLLHEMLHWYFAQTCLPLWLGTAPGTRAETFYLLNGWRPAGKHGTNEVKLEMDLAAYQQHIK